MIARKGVISTKKVRKMEELLKAIVDTTVPAKIALALSSISLVRRYIWAISNANLDTAKHLKQTGIKKHWKYTRQIKLELDCLYDWILALVIFVRYSYKVYENEEVTKNIKAR